MQMVQLAKPNNRNLRILDLAVLFISVGFETHTAVSIVPCFVMLNACAHNT